MNAGTAGRAAVKIGWKQIALPMMLSLAIVSAWAQDAPAPAAAVDPALLAKANGGDAVAENQVGDLYAAAANGAKPDYKQAGGWYRKAADQGYIPAEVHLADLYRDGRGMARDMAQAVAWYRKAADAGDAGAQGTLGILYSVGMGVAKDDVEAYYWLCLASAAKGPTQARYAANRQSVGEHITTDQQAEVQDRVAKWQAAHPHGAVAR